MNACVHIVFFFTLYVRDEIGPMTTTRRVEGASVKTATAATVVDWKKKKKLKKNLTLFLTFARRWCTMAAVVHSVILLSCEQKRILFLPYLYMHSVRAHTHTQARDVLYYCKRVYKLTTKHRNLYWFFKYKWPHPSIWDRARARACVWYTEYSRNYTAQVKNAVAI